MMKVAKDTLKMTTYKNDYDPKTTYKKDDNDTDTIDNNADTTCKETGECVLLSVKLDGVSGNENKFKCKYKIRGNETSIYQIGSEVLEDLQGCTKASK
eukprot:10629394-Ditylum_brightwellii.AAC.1